MCKKLLYLAPVALVLALLPGSTYAATVLDYDFSDGVGTTVTDLSGSGNDGTLVGFSNTAAGMGSFGVSEGWVVGGGLSFLDDGVRSYVETPLNLSALPGDFTLEFQANYAGASGWTPAIGSNASGCCAESIYFGIHNNLTDVEVRLQNSGGPVGPHPWSSPPDTTLHHLALVYDVATDGVEVFVDGTSIGTATRSGNMAGVTTQFSIANTGWASSEQWDGIIFGVAISDQKLGPGSFRIPNRPRKIKGKALDPSPDDGATDVLLDVALGWKPGEFANKHDVYFGTSLDDVNDATKASPEYKTAKMLGDESYAPGILDFGTTYYWRIDEVNAPPQQSTVFKGDVWQLTTEPFGYSIENVTATASSSEAGKGPENAANSFGLDANDLHSAATTTMWLSESGGPQPTWIQYEFDKVYKLHEMWVWNYNGEGLNTVFGIKDATIEYSINGSDWMLVGAAEFAKAPGAGGYAHDTTVDLSGVIAKYVRITTTSNHSNGLADQYGLSEVRFLNVPVRPREPYPESGATDVDVDVTLGWRAGRLAAEHSVYLSTDEQAVIDGTAPVTVLTEASHSPSSLDLDSTYYWRVNEVNDAEIPTTWQGDIWNLSTQEYVVVDDFESYNEIPAGEEGSNLVYETWLDGFDNPAANGSTMGYPTGASMETGTVYSGRQSAPMEYNNTTAAFSEVTRTLAPQNWTDHGIQTLSLWFYGDPTNTPGQLYMKINGVEVTYDGDAGNLMQGIWQQWNIDLSSLVGANLQSVTEIILGVGDGGSGIVLFDDIRLYPARRVPESIAPDDAGLVAHWEFEGDFSDATGKGHDGLAFGDPRIVNDPVRGQVLEVDGDDRVGFSDAPDFNYGADESLTLTVWANFEPADAPKGWKAVVAKGRTELAGGTGYIDELYGFYVSPGGNWHVNAGGIGGDALEATGGRWRHLAFVQDGSAGEGYFYIDGEVVISGGADSCDTAGRPLFIGAAGTDVEVDAFEPFKGRIDDVRIYSYALSGLEIQYLASLPADLNTDN